MQAGRYGEYKQGRTFVGRFDHGADVLESVNDFCNEKQIKTAYVNLIGAVTSIRIGYFDTIEQRYVYLEENDIQKPFEIAGCTGNVSIKDGAPFAHLHIVFSSRDGNCIGGHLMNGTKIYACEFYIQELIGENLVRSLDETTKLQLWN